MYLVQFGMDKQVKDLIECYPIIRLYIGNWKFISSFCHKKISEKTTKRISSDKQWVTVNRNIITVAHLKQNKFTTVILVNYEIM